MNVDALLNALDIEDSRAEIEAGWDESAASLPEGDPPFLAETFVKEGCAYVGLPQEVTDLAVDTGSRISASPELTALAWHCRRRIYDGGPPISLWPRRISSLGEATGFFYLLAAMSNWPEAQRVHQAHHIPAGIIANTMGDILRHMKRCRRKYGAWGASPLIAGGWMTNHFSGRIYALGRLQYIHRPFPPECIAFRNRRDGRVLALAAPDLEFRRDGRRNGASGVTETEGAWKSQLSSSDEEVVGHPIDAGRALAAREVVPLAREEWQTVLRPGDPTLEIHIPSDDPLTVEACAASAQQAAEFFPEHFPELPAPKAFKCNTWLLDPQLDDYLPPTANIVRFLREFHLFPVPGNAWSAIRFVFEIDIPYGAGDDPGIDFAALPQRTTLEKALLKHVRDGKRWRTTGGFILIDDLPWGRQVYRQ